MFSTLLHTFLWICFTFVVKIKECLIGKTKTILIIKTVLKQLK